MERRLDGSGRIFSILPADSVVGDNTNNGGNGDKHCWLVKTPGQVGKESGGLTVISNFDNGILGLVSSP